MSKKPILYMNTLGSPSRAVLMTGTELGIDFELIELMKDGEWTIYLETARYSAVFVIDIRLKHVFNKYYFLEDYVANNGPLADLLSDNNKRIFLRNQL